MPSLAAIRHVPFEDLDAFAPLLEGRGYGIRYCEAPTEDLRAPALAASDLLIVLGGPIGAYQEALYPFLADEIALIERRLAEGKPVLGICLGAQLMARALGARVYPSGGKEIGWSPLDLSDAGRRACLGRLSPATSVLHWHGDTFDVPAGAAHLASTRQTPNQAFAWERHGFALQFHVEVSAQGLERWYVGHALEIVTTPGISVPALREAGRRCAPALAREAEAVLGAWLDAL